MSREHTTPQATAWAYGLTDPAVVEVEDALKTLQWMWDYCDDIKRNHRIFGGNDMLMRRWSEALSTVEKLAQKYLTREEPAAPELSRGGWPINESDARRLFGKSAWHCRACNAWHGRELS